MRARLVAALLTLSVAPAFAVGYTTQLSSNITGSGTSSANGGGWCWFSDSRAIYDPTSGQIVTGWMTLDGKIQAATFDQISKAVTRSYLYNGNVYEPDDHDHPSFLLTPDGRYTAFYSKHAIASGPYTNYQTATSANSIAGWGTVQSSNVNVSPLPGYNNYNTTYASPFMAPSNWNTPNTVYNFWRGGNANPTYSTATYDSTTHTFSAWAPAKNLILNPTNYTAQTYHRPYAKYTTDKTDRIGVAFNDGHPGEINTNNVYFAYVGKNIGGELAYFDAAGTQLKTLANGPLLTTEVSSNSTVRLYQDTNTGAKTGNGWIWDTSFTSAGEAVVAYSVRGTGDVAHHSLYWAIYRAGQWITKTLVADAGVSITRSTVESDYAGGMALDPNDPFTVYVSAQANPSVLSSSFLLSQIELDAANPAGAVLSTKQISASGVDSFRPSVPEGLLQGDQTVLYVSGSYHYYANSGAPYYNAGYTGGTNVGYSTNILAWTAVPEPGTLSLLGLGAAGLLLRRRRS